MEFKLWRMIWTGIVGMLFMLPTAYATFYIFDLIALLTGGLIQNFFVLTRANMMSPKQLVGVIE